MSREERYGTRELVFSRWHRTLPDHVTCIDIDFLEYCQRCRQPLALIEIARDVGQERKPTIVLRQLAAKADIEAHLILYSPDMQKARVAMIYPTYNALCNLTGDELRKYIIRIHDSHKCLADAGIKEKPPFT